MTISSIISNVSLSVDGHTVTERGTFQIRTEGETTTITDQDTGQVWDVERIDSINFNVFKLVGGEGEEDRILTLGAVQRTQRTSDCGCKKKGLI